eukprot:Sspe_Gene.70079::Locus_41378_Transcript_1_1_Confidence_1.000_Length_2160::g.70079::m.70079
MGCGATKVHAEEITKERDELKQKVAKLEGELDAEKKNHASAKKKATDLEKKIEETKTTDIDMGLKMVVEKEHVHALQEDNNLKTTVFPEDDCGDVPVLISGKKSHVLEAAVLCKREPERRSSVVAASGEEVTVQVVALRKHMERLLEDKNVKVVLVNAAKEDYPEIAVNITGAPSLVMKTIVKCERPAEIEILPAPKVDCEAPPPPDPLAKEEGEVEAAGEEKPAEEEEEEAKPTAKQLEKSAFKCSSNITLGNWDGKVEVEFEWIDEPTPFSEVLDPSGSNWNSKWGGPRKAPVHPPKDIKLQWRHGPNGTWETIDAPGGKCRLTITPKEVSGMHLNGFQSRWVIDGELFLTHLQRAPTLITKLMKYPMIRNAYRALPPEKRDIDNLPEKIRGPVKSLENIIPMNTWDIGYGVSTTPGGFLEGDHVMTTVEKATNVAKLKMRDPKLLATARAEVLKAPIQVVNAALGTIGIKLNVIISNMDFFIPKPTEPDFEKYAEVQNNDVDFEQLRHDMQTDINTMYPDYQQGVRVAVPTLNDIKNAIQTKRPKCIEGTAVPVNFQHVYKDNKDYKEQHKIAIVIWPKENPSDADRIELEATEEEEKVSLMSSDKIPVWKEYKATKLMTPGVYHYYWDIDGARYYHEGHPMPEGKNNYCEVTVDCGVRFGIGVPMP